MNRQVHRRQQHGQNLLLFALTLFLLVLMVTLTLGIAMRVRDNHELQNVADVSAYTSAVVNARAYNDAALLNRLQVSYWVSQAADQSLISWTGYARAELSAAYQAAWTAGLQCNFFGMIDIFIAIFDSVIENNLTLWDTMDRAAGDESHAIQSKIAGLRDEVDTDIFPRLEAERQNQYLAKTLALRSKATGVTVLSGGPERVTFAETMCASGAIGGAGRGLCRGSAGWSAQMVDAAMGGRLHPFLTSRGVAPQLMETIWDTLRTASKGAIDVEVTPPTGSGYWAPEGGPWHGTNPSGERAWGDDHGSVTVTLNGPNPGLFGIPFPWLLNGCPATNTVPIITWVKSTEIEDDTDAHHIQPDWLTGAPNDIPDVHHTMGSCAPYCPSVWVSTFAFVEDSGEGDGYGQPKSYVGMERNYGLVNRPWDLLFSFQFDRSQSGTRFDNRGQRLVGPFSRGLDISHAVALSTGVTYYHRKGQRNGVDLWQETPNLLNPYWRATLAPADFDNAGDPDGPVATGDMATALGGPTHQWQLDAYQALVQQGFKGLH